MSFFAGIIGVLISLIGWFVFDSLFLLVLGTLFYSIGTILEWKKLNIGVKMTDLIIFVIGCIIAVITKHPFYIGGLLAINTYSAIIYLLELLLCIVGFFHVNPKNKNR